MIKLIVDAPPLSTSSYGGNSRWRLPFLSTVLLCVNLALAHSQPVQQSGQVTPGHAVQWLTNGVVGDGGTAAQGNLTSLGVTASGPGICQNSGPPSGPYNQICILANSGSGGAGISINNFGGASGGFTLSINGANQGFSTVTLPTLANSTACFTNTTGTLTSCTGGNVSGPATSTNGAIAVWNGTAGTLLANSAITISGSNLATPTINGNAITTGTGTLTLGAGKTFTASNTLTLTGTDGTSFAFPGTSDTVDTLAATQTVSGIKTFSGTFNCTGTCQLSGTAFGTFATQNFATPPAIGGTTPAAGSFATLTATTPVSVSSGGTGNSTLTAHGVLLGEGTTQITSLATNTPSLCLISQGATQDPLWGACSSGSSITPGAYITVSGSTVGAPFLGTSISTISGAL